MVDRTNAQRPPEGEGMDANIAQALADARCDQDLIQEYERLEREPFGRQFRHPCLRDGRTDVVIQQPYDEQRRERPPLILIGMDVYQIQQSVKEFYHLFNSFDS